MATRPTPREQGPKLTDQLDKIVALHWTGEVRKVEVDPFPANDAYVCEAVIGLDGNGLDPIYVPEMLAMGQVIKRQVKEAAEGQPDAKNPTTGWIIARLVKPGRAYQLDAEDIDDECFELLDGRLAEVLA
jgi:hypothetical protein